MRKDWVVGDIETYLQLARAFRGGNTHANRFFISDESRDPYVNYRVNSYDRASSYPDVMCNMLFPLGQWKKAPGTHTEKILQNYTERKRAFLFDAVFYNIRLKNIDWGCPYIPKDKCENLRKLHFNKKHEIGELGYIGDNGRIISAKEVHITITDVDYWIICQEYTWSKLEVYNLKYCRYQPLPRPFVELIQKYYTNKTALKGVETKKWLYNESKSKINSLYGLSAMKSIRAVISYENGEFIETMGDPARAMDSIKKRAFLPYSVGVYVTAWARYWLERAILLIYNTPGAHFLYTDTDSVKFSGTVDFTALNDEIISYSKKSNSCATDRKGTVHYMGVFEYEGTYQKFATMGAKKYLYEDEKGIHLTVSGLVKYNERGEEVSAKELMELGGIPAFRAGTVFSKAGGLEAVYNDEPEVKRMVIEGHELEITKNVCLKPSTYTLGLSGEYNRLLQMLKSGIDEPNLL